MRRGQGTPQSVPVFYSQSLSVNGRQFQLSEHKPSANQYSAVSVLFIAKFRICTSYVFWFFYKAVFYPTKTGVAPHGALGAKQDTTEQNFEARSEQEVMRVKLFRSVRRKATIEVTYNVPVSEGICRGNKLQRDGTNKRTSGLSVFPRCQMLILAFCLLFQEGHAGRILMYLPVATRYTFSTCSCVQTWNLSNVLHEQDSRWLRFYPTKMRKS